MNKFLHQGLKPYQLLTMMLVAFIGGILAAGFWPQHWSQLWPVYLLTLFLLLLSALANFLLHNHLLVVVSWLGLFALAGLAVYASQISSNFCPAALPADSIDIKGEVTSNPTVDSGGQEFILRADLPDCPGTRILVQAARFPSYKFGQQLKFSGTLSKPGMIGDFDYAKYLKPKLVSFLILQPQRIEIAGQNDTLVNRILSALYLAKNRFEASLNRTMAEPEASLGIGIITGSKGSISQEFKDALNKAGLTHIVALSGFNVTIIVVALAGVLSGLMSPKLIFWIGSAIVVVFIVMTGASASVVRAGIFSLIILYGRTFGRKAHETNIMLLAAAIMLAFNPFLLADDMGFQLSFLAFAGLIYLSRAVEFVIARSKASLLPDWIKSPLRETLSAQLAVFPLIAFAFGRISLISPISNVLVLWILPLAMLLSFCAGIGGLLLYPLGKLLAFIAWPILAYIIQATRWTASLPFASLERGKYNLPLIIILYSAIFVFTALIMRKIKKWQNLFQN